MFAVLFIATSYHARVFSFCHVFRNVIIWNGCHFAVWLIDIGQTAKWHPFHITTILNTINFVYHFIFMHVRSSSNTINFRHFLHFSLTCFDILSWNFAYDFVLLYYRPSSSVVNSRQFLWELCPFWNLKYWKYTVFRTSLTPFNILIWKFAYYFVFLYYRSILSVVNLRLFWSYASFRTWNTVNTVFHTFLLHALKYWAEILHMTLFYCTTGQLRVCRQWASIFVGVMSLLGLRILEIHSFPHFSPAFFDILSWNFVYHFIFMHVRSSSNAINFRHFLQELCSFLTSNSYKYAVFRTFLLHALTYWVQILYMTLF